MWGDPQAKDPELGSDRLMDVGTAVVGVLMVALLAGGIYAARTVDRYLKLQAEAESREREEARRGAGGRKKER